VSRSSWRRSLQDLPHRSCVGRRVRAALRVPELEAVKREVSGLLCHSLREFTHLTHQIQIRGHTSFINTRCLTTCKALPRLNAIPALEIGEPAVTKRRLLLTLILRQFPPKEARFRLHNLRADNVGGAASVPVRQEPLRERTFEVRVGLRALLLD
jgi:hypothetical protein